MGCPHVFTRAIKGHHTAGMQLFHVRMHDSVFFLCQLIDQQASLSQQITSDIVDSDTLQ